MITVLAFIAVIGVLIFFHELGHFIVARLCGVGVKTFSLGFGPKLLAKRIGITEYRISAIPLGGYVKMVGEEPDGRIDPADIPVSFTHKHVFKRILIVAAGPVFNILLAVILFTGIYQIYGLTLLKPSIGVIQESTPAHKGGLQENDLIIAINKTPVETWNDVTEIIVAGEGRRLTIDVRREEYLIVADVTPELMTTKDIFGMDIERYMIGITPTGDTFLRDLNLLQAMIEGIKQTYKISELVVTAVVKLILGDISMKALGGPIMIAEMAGQQAREGVVNLIFFIALLSINLAILNLLPIPVLDGGHLVFLSIEVVKGRPVSKKVLEIANQAGVFMLILLMIFVIYNDIVRVFFS